MHRLIALAVILMNTAAFSADVFHVTTVRDWTVTDPAPVSRGPKVQVVIGSVGTVKYTTQQLFTWGSQRFEMGKDYQVLKSDAKSLTVMMHDRKGHEVKERLDVTSAESQ